MSVSVEKGWLQRFGLSAALAGLVLLAPGRAEAQVPGPGPLVQFDPNAGIATYDFSFSQSRSPVTVEVGLANQNLLFSDPVNPLTAGPGCRFQIGALGGSGGSVAICPGPPQLLGLGVRLHPLGINVLTFSESAKGGNINIRAYGGTKKDSVITGQGSDQIHTGKGPDVVLPGGGGDVVNTGPQNDRINARGPGGSIPITPDMINGGAGKRDVAVVDKQDKVKNVEIVKRK